MSEVTEPTVDDLPAEADSLQVLEVELGSIADEDVREPHRHGYHELIWIREGQGQHLIDGEPVEFGPHTLTLIAKGQVHQFRRAEDIRALVARFDDDWLEDGLAGELRRAVLFTGTRRTTPRPPGGQAGRVAGLLHLLPA